MGSAAERTLEARQGDTFKLTVTWKDSSGSAIDITGASAELGIASRAGGSPSFQYDENDYLTITGAQGKVEISVPHDETRKWTRRRYVYEVTITDSSNERTTLLHGTLKVEPEIVA